MTQDEMHDQLAANIRKNYDQQLQYATQVTEFEMKNMMLQVAISRAMSMFNEPMIAFQRALMR
jgi:hypothetical protein